MTTLKLKLGAQTPIKLKLNPGIAGPQGPIGQTGPQGIPGGSVADGDKGDITVTGSGAIWTIDADAVTYDKIQNISATARFIGRITGGAGNAEELTGTQATTLLDPFTDILKGVAPASGGGTANFLRADGTWVAPPGTSGVADGDKGDIVVSGSGTIWTIDSGVVTLAKMANMNTDRLIGRDTAASGIPEEISVGGGVEFTGSLGIQTSAFTGDVTKSAGGTALTIAADAVTYAKLQNVSATARFIGRITAGAGDAEELTGTQATTLIDPFTNLLKGLAPASGGGTTNFLRADGTWTSPTAVVADGDKGDITVSASGATWTIDNTAVSYAKIQNVSATSRVLGRKTAGAGSTEECTLSEVLDFIGSPAHGDILYRGASSWARLGAGTSGYFLQTQGAAANPQWAAAAPSGSVRYDAAQTLTAAEQAQARANISAPLKGHIFGLTLSNNGTDPTNDIDVAAGEAASTEANPVLMVLASALTKRLDAAWAVGTNQGGLDTGTVGDGTYHIWEIRRSDNGVVDVLFSLSASAPTMPANYDQKRRIWSIVRTGGAIKPFIQNGDRGRWVTAIRDVNATNPGTSAVTRTLTLPTGIVVWADMATLLVFNTSTVIYGLMSSLDETDSVPSGSIFNIGGAVPSTGFQMSNDLTTIKTNTSAQIRSRLSASGASDVLIGITCGWLDRRGQDGGL